MFPAPTISFTQGSDRELIQADEAAVLKASGALIIDERRTRTRYFDGRFLAAKDEIRDQNYFLTRLSDLGRAGGTGVVSGLLVAQTSPTTITIAAGQGVTPAGETVMVPADQPVALVDIAAAEQLDVVFGLSRIPTDLARNRSGLFIVGLRPVEYTANPVASYPTTINGPRTVQDGDIIEAAAIVLVPYVEQGAQGSADTRQARVARSIFVDGGALGTPENVLPLAMIAMDRGVVQWVDSYMVRREIGTELGNGLGFGFSPRAVREAYLQQYLGQLNQVLKVRAGGNMAPRFAASDYFEALPAAGVMPAAAIDSSDFSQIFFPPQIQTSLSIIPDDEMAVLIEESLLLPPINLTDTADELESTSILVLVPVPRAQFPTIKATLTTVAVTLKPAVPGLVFQRKPIQSLLGLTALRLPPPIVNQGSTIDKAWRAALARNPLLWYVRRRNLEVQADAAGTPVRVPINDTAADQAALTAMQSAGLTAQFNLIKGKASSLAFANLVARLASPAVAANPILASGAITQLAKGNQFDQATILQATEPLVDPHLGEGLARAQQLNADMTKPAVVQAVGASGAAIALDKLGRSLDTATLTDLTKQIATLTAAGGSAAPGNIAALINKEAGGQS